MLELKSQIAEAVKVICSHWSRRPMAGIVLGTGLGDLANHIRQEVAIDFTEIPHFPRTTALGHKGRLICGELAGVPVVTMEGRFHLYEGYSAQQVTLPVRVMGALGIQKLFLSNASGGLNPQFRSGDVVVIDDHVNLMWRNPLVGINDEQLGPRFPDMCQPFDRKMNEFALEIARQNDFVAHRGVYVGVIGPNYETRAECRFLRRLGDVVGMSTVPEVIVAAHAGIRVMALSTVTNLCLPDQVKSTSGEEVIAIAAEVEPKLRAIVTGVLQQMATTA
ncbi:MAG: purine-nucleoside phosphorylase [Pirellulaceae bacterium]|nr:purine-nucleoside phosphorylase [Pirellulaceae bacterium]